MSEAPRVDHEFRKLIPPLRDDELALLEAQMVAAGRASDALKTWDGLLLDGHNRLAICARLKLPYRTEAVKGIANREEARLWIEENQLARRNLTDDQRAAVAYRVLERRTTLAKVERAQAAGKSGGVGRAKKSANSLSDTPADKLIPKGKTDNRKKTAKAARVSERKLRAISRIAKADPKAADRIAKGETTIIQEQAALNAAERAATALEPSALPPGKFETIVIDPPWQMEKIEREVRPNQVGFDYPTMDEDQIAHFPVPDMAADDCHLFCWTTQRFMPMALRLVERWGFRYVLEFVWHKPGGFQPIGLPQYNCEFAVYARRGTPKFVDTKNFFACFQAPRREHSRKPNEFYDVIRRVTAGPRIDVFSREARDGFAQHGNEAGKFAVAS